MYISPYLTLAILRSGYLNPVEFKIFDKLIDCMNAKTFKCFPKQATLSTYTQLSISTVKRAVESLKSKGILKVIHKIGDKGGYVSNYYFLNLDLDFWKSISEQAGLGIDFSKIAAIEVPFSNNEILKLMESDAWIDASISARKIAKSNSRPLKVNRKAPKKSSCTKSKVKSISNDAGRKKITNAQNCNPGIPMDQIKQYFEYDNIISELNKPQIKIIDSLFTVIRKVFNSDAEIIKINTHDTQSKKDIVKQIKVLDVEDFQTLACTISNGVKKIKNRGAYFLTCLLDLSKKVELNTIHEVNEDLYNHAKTFGAKGNCEKSNDIDNVRVTSGMMNEVTDYDAILRDKYPYFRVL